MLAMEKFRVVIENWLLISDNTPQCMYDISTFVYQYIDIGDV